MDTKMDESNEPTFHTNPILGLRGQLYGQSQYNLFVLWEKLLSYIGKLRFRNSLDFK